MKTLLDIELNKKVRISFKFHSSSYERYGREIIGKVVKFRELDSVFEDYYSKVSGDTEENKFLEVDTFSSVNEIPYMDVIDVEYLDGEAFRN